VRGFGLAAALAVALVASRAAAFTRSSPDGKPLAWPVPAIAYAVNDDAPPSPSCAPTAAGDPALEAVRASFAAWERSCSDLSLSFAGKTTEFRVRSPSLGGTSDNLVVFRHGWCSENAAARNDPCFTDWNVDCGNTYDCFEDHESCPGGADCSGRSTVALTTVTYDPQTGRIVDADIEVNGWDGTGGPSQGTPGDHLTPPTHGWYFTCNAEPTGTTCSSYGDAGCDFIDLQNTVTHEVGHFIGLAHSSDSSTTMWDRTEPAQMSKRILSADDVNGVCTIYPDRGGGCGCGGAGGDPVGLVALALVAILRSRSRPRTRPPAGRLR
jgi:hypothetical protein